MKRAALHPLVEEPPEYEPTVAYVGPCVSALSRRRSRALCRQRVQMRFIRAGGTGVHPAEVARRA